MSFLDNFIMIPVVGQVRGDSVSREQPVFERAWRVFTYVAWIRCQELSPPAVTPSGASSALWSLLKQLYRLLLKYIVVHWHKVFFTGITDEEKSNLQKVEIWGLQTHIIREEFRSAFSPNAILFWNNRTNLTIVAVSRSDRPSTHTTTHTHTTQQQQRTHNNKHRPHTHTDTTHTHTTTTQQQQQHSSTDHTHTQTPHTHTHNNDTTTTTTTTTTQTTQPKSHKQPKQEDAERRSWDQSTMCRF